MVPDSRPPIIAYSQLSAARRNAPAACLLLAAAALAGCVTTSTATDNSAEDPSRRARIRMELAFGYFEREQYEPALEEINRAISADPKFSPAYNMRGLIYSKLKDVPMAEASFLRAIAVNPRDGDAQHNMGWLLCDSGRYAQGRQYLDMALANPYYQSKQRTEAAKGVCEQKAGNTAGAEALLISALDDNPQNAIASNALAELYFKQGDYRKAAMYASQANVRSRATPASLWLAMRIEHQLGNGQGVQRYARQLQEAFPEARQNRLYERGAWNNE